ncbi:sensor histidine kinase [Arsukibacterium sp. UBA3155]|uniref:sensor histidine kinase n=1 Tax=Arsukibacterium sp. UBA3155 TaxID=1946058 RepID=UPI0025BED19C|nr:sensor histidine kinase [Arsukibacterium sp. UBA3155]
MTNEKQQDIELQLTKLSVQQKQLQIQLRENNLRMQHILRRVWQINDKTQKRIANDLHDGVGQLLTALVNELATTGLNAEQQQRAKALAELALQDTRQISRLLRPPVLDDLGLQPALKWLVRQITNSCPQLKISLAVAADLQLDEELQVMIFRVCQEALTNTVKYANATQATITIMQQGDTLTLHIADDGVGFELDAQAEQGVGLCSMQDRAFAFGGRCIIEAAPSQGCSITITVPLKTGPGVA